MSKPKDPTTTGGQRRPARRLEATAHAERDAGEGHASRNADGAGTKSDGVRRVGVHLVERVLRKRRQPVLAGYVPSPDQGRPVQQSVEVEELLPHPPNRAHRRDCAAMVFVGALFISVAVIFSQVWGPLRIILMLVGATLVVSGFVLLVGARAFTFVLGRDGCEAAVDIPTGVTRKRTVITAPEDRSTSHE
jgi:hypothetical protein